MKGLPHVIDIRNIGLIGAIEFDPIPPNLANARMRASSRRSIAASWCALPATSSRCRRHSSSRRRRSTSLSISFPASSSLRIERQGIAAMHTIQNAIDGRKVTSASRRIAPIYNPATGEQIAALPLSTAAEVNSAVAAAKKAALGWGTTPPLKRIKHMFRFKELLDATPTRSPRDLERARQDPCRRRRRGRARHRSRRVRLRHSASAQGRVQPQRRPGDRQLVRSPAARRVAGITPFNFPAMVPMWMFPVAIACGNTFVLKPSERDPSASMLVAELFQEAGFPAGRVQRRAWRQGSGRRDPRPPRHQGGELRRLDAGRRTRLYARHGGTANACRRSAAPRTT